MKTINQIPSSMKITTIKNKLTLGLTGLALAAGSANAAIALVDLGTAASVTNPASDGKYWTSVGTGTNNTSTALDLIDIANASTSWDIAITTTSIQDGGTSGAGFGGTGIDGPSGADPFDEANAITDGVFANNNGNGTVVFAFTGFIAGATYDFSAIGGRDSGGADGQIIILDSAIAIGNGAVGLRDNYTLADSGTVRNFSVDATVGGEIWFEFRSTASGSTLNALSIEGAAVPEPSGTALLGLGGLALILRRRR